MFSSKRYDKICWLSYDNRNECLEDFFQSLAKIYKITCHRASCTLYSYGQKS